MKKKIVGVVAIVVILAAISATVMPVSATQDLKITAHNLDTLNSFTYSGAWHNVGANNYLLKWYGGGEYFDPPWKAPAVYHGIITATIMADYKGYYWGECVSMVKNLANSTVTTSKWSRGKHVMNGGVSPGTAIATFVWNSTKGRDEYKGHAAIFRQYTRNPYGGINGMMVWEQNWTYNEKHEGIVGMHKISKTGTGRTSDSNAYYVVKVS